MKIRLLRILFPIPQGRTEWMRSIHKNLMRGLFFAAFFNLFVIYAPTPFVQEFPNLPTIPKTQMQNKLLELQKTCQDTVPDKLPTSAIVYRTDPKSSVGSWSRTTDSRIIGDAMDWAIKNKPSKYSITKVQFCK